MHKGIASLIASRSTEVVKCHLHKFCRLSASVTCSPNCLSGSQPSGQALHLGWWLMGKQNVGCLALRRMHRMQHACEVCDTALTKVEGICRGGFELELELSAAWQTLDIVAKVSVRLPILDDRRGDWVRGVSITRTPTSLVAVDLCTDQGDRLVVQESGPEQ